MLDVQAKVLDSLLVLFAMPPHVLNGLMARKTMQLFVPRHLLRKRTEEAVAATAHVHSVPTFGLELSEALT